jgi:hypothetical protein
MAKEFRVTIHSEYNEDLEKVSDIRYRSIDTTSDIDGYITHSLELDSTSTSPTIKIQDLINSLGTNVSFFAVSYKQCFTVDTSEDVAILFDVVAGASTALGRMSVFSAGAVDSNLPDITIQNLEIPTVDTDIYVLTIHIGYKN